MSEIDANVRLRTQLPADLIVSAQAPDTDATPAPAFANDQLDAQRPAVGAAPAEAVELTTPGTEAARPPARGSRQEYIVFMPQDGELAVGRSAFANGVMRSMMANQTEEQRALSNEERGRYVTQLTSQEAETYRRSGLRVFENYEINAPTPLLENTSDEFGPHDAVSNATHGVDALQSEPGWTGEGTLY
ncbi:MAG: hypothetical protein AAFQ82_25905, partial [Myxococcota bacterium]